MIKISIIIGIILIIVFLTLVKLKPLVMVKLAFKTALKDFPKEIVENAERIFRLETNHFKSGQFLGTFSPGMEKFGEKYPYGWNTLAREVWSKYPQFKPTGFKSFTEGKGVLGNGGKVKQFLVFPSVIAAVYTLCGFLEYYENNPGRWFSTNTDSQTKYNKSIVQIIPRFTHEAIS